MEGEGIEVKDVQLQRSDLHGYGFSVLGGTGLGLPPVIYEVVEDSPAALCGVIESGDVIESINDRIVLSLTTKEVLKCLRLSNSVVNLKVRKDPLTKEKVRRHIAASSEMEALHKPSHHGMGDEVSRKKSDSLETNGTKENDENIPPSPRHDSMYQQSDSDTESVKSNRSQTKQPKFEAFMMTGDLIINLNAKTSHSCSLLSQNQRIEPSSYIHNSTPASPEECEYRSRGKGTKREASNFHSPVSEKKGSFSYNNSFVRTSRSEDHLQKASLTTVNIDIDEDMASSLNTLLDTKQDSSSERIVWTYNAPVKPGELPLSPPTSPTSCSSSSSSKTTSPEKSVKHNHTVQPGETVFCVDGKVANGDNGFDSSQKPKQIGQRDDHSETEESSEIISAFSSSDDTEQLPASTSDLSSPIDNLSPSEDIKQEDWVVDVDSRETDGHNELVKRTVSSQEVPTPGKNSRDKKVKKTVTGDNRVHIHASCEWPQSPESKSSSSSTPKHKFNKSIDRSPSTTSESAVEDMPYQELKDNQDEDPTSTETEGGMRQTASPPTDDESDIDSLHSFHYSPKAVDMPSASRLAKRLYNLEGFKKTDVSRHLSKNNDFSRVVAEEFLKYFDFTGDTLDVALRKFLKQFCLIGETQERERVLVHFSKRYLDCNPGFFKSQDAVHTLTCAVMLLNTDLHSENVGRLMTCVEFIENLSELNDGENFPRDVLKALYHSIKSSQLEWAVDEEEEEEGELGTYRPGQDVRQGFIGQNPFLEVPNPSCATEYKKGYVMRKCCVDPGGKRTPLGKRGWKMFYVTLRDMVLYLHKDEHGFKRNQMYDSLHNAVRIHHCLATKATDYSKKQHVFRLQTADQAEYLFQTSDSKELQSWIDTINLVAASLSAAPLPTPVGSQNKFQRPLMPVSHTKSNLREQLQDQENRIVWLERELEEHLAHIPEKGAKSRIIHDFVEKEAYLQFELKRYRTYAFLLRSKMAQFPELEPSLVETSIGEVEEPHERGDYAQSVPSTPSGAKSSGKHPLPDRYSYRAAIYKNNMKNDCG
ncbi:uncharacterized protein LOC143233882 isoform X2 [Tachypleus tridentatus]|uniref:uncharacterized protein LOC143233882 isoform X2 n=1 Tax=Tachypleus tridentatus TaxID=6853 RepID=UPI003FCF4E35